MAGREPEPVHSGERRKSPDRAILAESLALGHSLREAAAAAGYTYDSARHVARTEAVRKMIDARTRELWSEGAPLAQAVLARIIADESAPAQTRGNLALAWLDRAGHKPVQQVQEIPAPRSRDEIIAALKAAAEAGSREAIRIYQAVAGTGAQLEEVAAQDAQTTH